MLIRTVVIVAIVLCNACLLGCRGSHEPDSLIYIVAVGFDKAQEPGKLEVSFQIALPRTGSSGEGGGGEPKKNAVVVSIKAATLAEAYNLLGSAIAYTPTLSHTKMLVFGEELARDGVQDIMGPAMRFRQYRGSMHVAVVRGTAAEFFKSNQPIFDITLSKYYEVMMESFSESSYYLDTSLHTFYMRLKTFNGQAYATLLAVNPTTGKGVPADSTVPGGKAETYIAGDMPRQGGNKAEFMGTAMFRGDKMVGILDNDETRMLSMLLGTFNKGFLSVVDPLDPKRSVNVFLSLQQHPSIKTRIEDGLPYIRIQINLEGEISAIPSGIHYEKGEYLSLLEEQVSQVITERMEKMLQHTQAVGSDVVGFGSYFRPHFLTGPEFKNYNWINRYSEAIIQVNVKTDLRRYGLMLKSSAIQEK
ncbi:MAG: Ger(x)C family spore germination protein [Pelosinus sp.]|nr:Ger(x)C family spore germination protein [Pelosinus sp.]